MTPTMKSLGIDQLAPEQRIALPFAHELLRIAVLTIGELYIAVAKGNQPA